MNFRILAGFLIVVGPTAVVASDAWPMFQRDAGHTGYLPVTLDATQFRQRWERRISKQGLNPVTVAEGSVYVSTIGGFSDDAGLYALNQRRGAARWHVPFSDVFSVNPPSYDDGKVYVQTGNHSGDTWLRAYHAGSGRPLFQAPHEAQWERYQAPTIYGHQVFVNGGYYGGMYGFNGRSGGRRWFIDLAQEDNWTPAVDAKYAYAHVGNQLVAIERLYGGCGATPLSTKPASMAPAR